jgi:hypothetical protein
MEVEREQLAAAEDNSLCGGVTVEEGTTGRPGGGSVVGNAIFLIASFSLWEYYSI